VINKEGEEERINHWVNKNWKLGGDIHSPMDDKLKFLYEIGRREQVGMFLRNQNILDKSFEEQYKKRAECEKTHGHIKSTVKFDIRRIRNVSKKLYSLLSFISYQLLVLTELQNQIAGGHPNLKDGVCKGRPPLSWNCLVFYDKTSLT